MAAPLASPPLSPENRRPSFALSDQSAEAAARTDLEGRVSALELHVARLESDLAVARQGQAVACAERDEAARERDAALARLASLESGLELAQARKVSEPVQAARPPAEEEHAQPAKAAAPSRRPTTAPPEPASTREKPHKPPAAMERGAFWRADNEHNRTNAAAAAVAAPGVDAEYKKRGAVRVPHKPAKAVVLPAKSSDELEDERLLALEMEQKSYTFPSRSPLSPLSREASRFAIVELPRQLHLNARRPPLSAAEDPNAHAMRVRVQRVDPTAAEYRATAAAADPSFDPAGQDRSVGHRRYEHYKWFGYAGHGARSSYAHNPTKPPIKW